MQLYSAAGAPSSCRNQKSKLQIWRRKGSYVTSLGSLLAINVMLKASSTLPKLKVWAKWFFQGFPGTLEFAWLILTLSGCPTWSKIIFAHLTILIIAFWRCVCLSRRPCLNSRINFVKRPLGAGGYVESVALDFQGILSLLRNVNHLIYLRCWWSSSG